MKKVGVICECNPFHAGHAHLFRELRRAGAEQIICVMSEYFVQRCEPAVLPAHDRAAAAVACGADAVFSLPFPWSCASASFFASAGVSLLFALGCDTVAFGSESGDLALLREAAEHEPGKPEPAAGTASVFPPMPPNDILGTEYIRAAARLRLPTEFFAVTRTGAAHDSTLPETAATSSSAARKLLLSGGMPPLPKASARAVRSAMAEGACPVSGQALEDAIFAFWRAVDPEKTAEFAECGGGVARRLHRAAAGAVCYAEMMRLCATKKYTDARLRRAALFAFCAVRPADLRAEPAYTRLLCFSGGAAEKGLLNTAGTVSAVGRVRDIPESEAAKRQRALETLAESLYTLCLPVPRPAGTLLVRSAFPYRGIAEDAK